MNACFHHRFATPIGDMTAACDESGALVSLLPDDNGDYSDRLTAGGGSPQPALFEEVRRQLDAYFAGKRREFSLPLAPKGTPFQRHVWAALLSIPFGSAVSYGELSRQLGQPGAVRAVGRANGANPICIVVPCHRVIGHDRSLTGYGGGLPMKEALLRHEGIPYREMGQQPALPGLFGT